MKTFRIVLLFIFSITLFQVHACVKCSHAKIGNLKFDERIVNYALKNRLKNFLVVMVAESSDLETTYMTDSPPTIIKYRDFTLLDSDELVEAVVDVGASITCHNKSITSPSSFLLVVAKQATKAIVREKTLKMIEKTTHIEQRVRNATSPMNDNIYTSAYYPYLMEVAGMGVRLGVDYCLDSLEAWVIHKINHHK